MKCNTLNDIKVLETLIAVKTDKINRINKEIDKIRATYKSLNDRQLGKAINRVQQMKNWIVDERRFIKQAKAEINAFYRPAAM